MNLFINDGDTVYRLASPDEIIGSAKRIIEERFGERLTIESPKDALEYIQSQIATLEHEAFSVLFLDNRHRVISFDVISRGTIDQAAVYPREILKEALRYNACAVLCAHNHCSGVVSPSEADKRITKRLKTALEMIDVRILDHFIVSGTQSYSFAEHGEL